MYKIKLKRPLPSSTSTVCVFCVGIDCMLTALGSLASPVVYADRLAFFSELARHNCHFEFHSHSFFCAVPKLPSW